MICPACNGVGGLKCDCVGRRRAEMGLPVSEDDWCGLWQSAPCPWCNGMKKVSKVTYAEYIALLLERGADWVTRSDIDAARRQSNKRRTHPEGGDGDSGILEVR